MSLSREALGARLRPLLSLTEGRGCVELLTLAGLPSGRGYAQTAAVALNEMVAKGLARREKPYGHGPQFFAVPAPAAASEERVGLPELDAILTFRTTVSRPFGAPSDRTTVTCTALLGPSWPESTRVPPWSTGLFASQVAAGGLGAAKANGTARLRAALSALRADPTPPSPPSPPEVPVSDPDLISALLSYCAGVSGGAKDSSVHSWLKARRLTRTKAEELLEQLVADGRLQMIEKPIAGGEVVVRYLPAEAVEPAPLPTSDAPPEEPPNEVEETPEEPTLVAGAAEPCQECERLRQERDMAQGEAHGLRQQLGEVRRQDSVAWVQLREDLDAARRQLSDHEGDWALLRSYLSLGDKADRQAILDRGFALTREASAGRPVVDPGAIAHYLLELPEERWEALAQARRDLAQGRRLAEHGARLQAEARAAVDRLLDTPAGTPAPELVPDPIPLGESIPAPPPSGEQPTGGTMADRALEFFRAHPTEEIRAQQLADALGGDRQGWTVPLSTLTAEGQIERVSRGVYRLARKGRRAA